VTARGIGAFAPPAGEPAAGDRAVGHNSQSVPVCGWQNVFFDGADQNRVRGLLADERFEVVRRSGPLRFHNLAAGEAGTAGVADLALVNEVGEGGEGLLDRGVRLGPGESRTGRCSQCSAD
jgi:hypothetical protein